MTYLVRPPGAYPDGEQTGNPCQIAGRFRFEVLTSRRRSTEKRAFRCDRYDYENFKMIPPRRDGGRASAGIPPKREGPQGPQSSLIRSGERTLGGAERIPKRATRVQEQDEELIMNEDDGAHGGRAERIRSQESLPVETTWKKPPERSAILECDSFRSPASFVFY